MRDLTIIDLANSSELSAKSELRGMPATTFDRHKLAGLSGELPP